GLGRLVWRLLIDLQAALEDLGQRHREHLAKRGRLADVTVLERVDDAVLEGLGLGQNVPQRVEALADDGQPGQGPDEEQRQDHPLVADEVTNHLPGHAAGSIAWKVARRRTPAFK